MPKSHILGQPVLNPCRDIGGKEKGVQGSATAGVPLLFFRQKGHREGAETKPAEWVRPWERTGCSQPWATSQGEVGAGEKTLTSFSSL